MKLSGAQIVLECLKKQGVDTIFGFPGGAVIPLYDALYDSKNEIKHYRTCHEQGAVHAADGYSRTTGKVGVCLVTSGPGATNTITGIATAYLDSIPLVIISGQVSTTMLGRDAFQEVDITAMTLTITKHCEMVKRVDQLEAVLMRAFDIARSGRPGPVLIDIPKDIMMQMADLQGDVCESSPKEMNLSSMDDAIATLSVSIKPVILVGGGVIQSNSSKAVLEFATQRNIPVVNTLMGSGAFPQSHPLSMGLIGMHGSEVANRYLASSDLVIAIGVRFNDRVIGASEKFCAFAKIIQIDIDINEMGKNKDVTFPLIGHIPDVLQALSDKSNTLTWDFVNPFKKTKVLTEQENQKHLFPMAIEEKLSPKAMLRAIKNTFGDEAIVVTEVGQHQMWTAQYYGFENPRTLITSGGLGTMGFGLGAAIGSKIGNPTKRVLHFAGDGSFKMNCNELGTVSKYKLPICTFVFNNRALGMVRQWQKLFNEARFSETDGDDSVDFVKLADAYGLMGYRVKTIDELEKVLAKIKSFDQPILVDCVIDCDENVFPIIPPGKGVAEMITHEQ